MGKAHLIKVNMNRKKVLLMDTVGYVSCRTSRAGQYRCLNTNSIDYVVGLLVVTLMKICN